MVKPVTDANAYTTTLEPVPVAGVTRCRVCGYTFVGWEEGKATYWVNHECCCLDCYHEAWWRHHLQSLGRGYYPDPMRYDKLGRRLRAPG